MLVPIKSMTTAVVMPVCSKTSGISRHLTSRYTSTERKKAYTTAMAEASVAVKIPPRMPPKTITTSNTGGIALKKRRTPSPRLTFSPWP